jgi:tetratricopeptide (TPR) repeat protein
MLKALPILTLPFLSLLIALGIHDKSPTQSTSQSSAPPPASAQSTSPSPTPPQATQPQNSSVPLAKAKDLFNHGDFDHASEIYSRLIQEYPNSGDAYAGLTRVYLKKKDVKQASDTITKALQVADSPPVRVALGEVYFRQGKISAAELEWVNVIKSGHQEARAYYGLARVRAVISMYKASLTMLNEAHRLDPTDPEIRRRWVAHQSTTDKIKFLQEELASDSNDDEETRAAMRHYLEYLQALGGQNRKDTCHLVTQNTATETKLVRLMYTPSRIRGFGLTVAVNNQKSNLLLDTGASGILINRNLAEKAGVTKLSDTDIRGIGDKGNKGAYTGLAGSLKIGDLEFRDCPVAVLEQRSVTGEDGLIGADVFAAFLVDLDFPEEKLRLSPLPKRPDEAAPVIALKTDSDDSSSNSNSPAQNAPENPNAAQNPAASAPTKTAPPANTGPQDRYIAPEMKSYTQIYRFGHNLLVPTSIGKIPMKLFVLDTGASSNLISPAAASEVTGVHGDPNMTVHGVSGSVKNVYVADKAVIQFGHLRQENQDLISFDLSNISNSIGTEVSGMLGFKMLTLLDIKIDYRDGLIDFNYIPRH